MLFAQRKIHYPIWPILFDLLNKNVINTNLASAIKVAYNLHNSRKTKHPDFLFVVTDGIFSSSETQRIIKKCGILPD